MAAELHAYCLFTCSFFLAVCLSRLIFVVISIRRKRKSLGIINQRRKDAAKTMVVMGSGGHTSEMLRLLSGLSDSYSPREYVIATTDSMSEKKVTEFELKRKNDQSSVQYYSLRKIPRSREVKQSYVTSVATTLHAGLYSLPLVFSSMPDVVLTNGPGTCIPICLTAFLIKLLGLKNITIVYIESICRVETLSLSAKMLYHIADYLIVQWPELQKRYPLTTYIGRTV